MSEPRSKHTVVTFAKAKETSRKLAAVTAYDFPFASFAERAGIDLILVGDSLGMVQLGYDDTLPVTMDDMIHHCKAVRRGAPNTFVVGDMPSMSYHESNEQAVRNAGRFIKEGRCDAVKLEWCNSVIERVKAITDAGILVMGHVGFTPQRIAQLGGYRIQGRGDAKKVVVDQGRQLQAAGAFCVLMEMVPPEVGKAVTDALDVFTIGVGAGADTDMQMVVINDLLGIFDKFKPKYVKRYLDIADMATEALKQYSAEIREGQFPTKDNFYS